MSPEKMAKQVANLLMVVFKEVGVGSPTDSERLGAHGHHRAPSVQSYLLKAASFDALNRAAAKLTTLMDGIFDAFGRWEEHMYEFQLRKGPMDPKARRYVLPNALEIPKDQPNPPIGRVDQTTLDSLGLKVGDRFGYWFDFGDDW